MTHKYKNQKKSEISDSYIEKSEPKIKKNIIAFLDFMDHVWDYKINLYFSPLKSGKDLEYFSRVLPSSRFEIF